MPSGRADTEEQPLLSVVVPMFDVENYVRDCLDSLLGQSYQKMEIILVDDGCTDSTADIAREYAGRDERIQIATQDNAGLGAARNTGARRATGRFLVFLDSDDTIPHDAYQRLVETLVDTGSDLAVGCMAEQMGDQFRVPDWLVPIHRVERRCVTLDQAPDVVHNAFAWNKMFRHDFWKRLELQFPEGVYYEDHVPMASAYLAARSIDIVPDVVYRWRTRSEGSSITKRKHELPNLADALAAKIEETRLISAHGSAATEEYWHSVMFDDLRPYARRVEGAADEYWAAFRDGVRELVEQVPDSSYEDIAVRVRLMVWLTAQDRRSDVEDLFRQLQDEQNKPPVVRQDGRDRLAVRGLFDADSGVPAGLFDLAPADRHVRARVVEVTISDPATVQVRGWFRLLGVCDRSKKPAVSLRLRDRRSRVADLWVDGVLERESPAGDWRAESGTPVPWTFAATIQLPMPTPAEPSSEPGDRDESWGVDLVVNYDQFVVDKPFTGASKETLQAARSPGRTDGGLQLGWEWGPGLHLTRSRPSP